MWPSVNGIRLYIHRAFGEKISLVAALTYMSVVTLVVGTEAYVLSHVLNAALPAISPPWWIFLMLTLATAINFRGLKIAGAFQTAGHLFRRRLYRPHQRSGAGPRPFSGSSAAAYRRGRADLSGRRGGGIFVCRV